MNRKILYVIIAVLVVILAAGVVMVFTMQNPTAAPKNPSVSADATQNTGEAAAPTADPVTGEVPTAPGADVPAAVTDPTASEAATEPTTESGETTEPTEDTKPTDPTDASEGPLIPDAPVATQPANGPVTYLDYLAMTGEQQMAFINTFSSYDAFFAWFNAAKEAYEDSLIVIDGSTPVDGGNVHG